MSGSVPRRRLLSGGAAFAAAAVMTAPAIKKGFENARSADGETLGTVVVRWNSKVRAWAKRPQHAEFGVVFLSTNDPAATPPTDADLQCGDVWHRHMDA